MIVTFKLRTTDIFNIEARVNEVQEIKEWLDELVEWDDTKYKMTIHSSGARCTVWFDNHEHAIMCKLRWV